MPDFGFDLNVLAGCEYRESEAEAAQYASTLLAGRIIAAHADLHLSSDQEIRLAKMFATEPAVVRRMTFANVAQSSHRLLAARPVQYCTNCRPGHTEPAPILRSQLLGWRITCPLSGNQLRDAGGRELPSPFLQYRGAALRGEKLLDDEAERGIQTWTSPAEIARLLLMRRGIWPLPREHELWRYRVLGATIPDLDHVVAAEQENLPTPAKPILPLHLRPALLAGVAIVERAGPEIHRRGPWRSFEAVEFATLEWVDWFNNRRLLEPIGNIPPAEAEERY
ncbi:hypothetical protein MesoLjLa_65390 (plasmid) [Mesorhizobium sp. L-2-11]|nr:hypothetical protein MesoLjLa_65390 [Mesorhizobium sp. L-2-11]